MIISSIRIQNFRSIKYFDSQVAPLNILVGHNDEGKSNVLRALDLFFNGNKRHDGELNWIQDHCAFADKPSKKAERIIIELKIVPPDTFNIKPPVTWTKEWRKEGLVSDLFSPNPSRSKLGSFLRAIRYDYVPAIKGEIYFQNLMGQLYDMLARTVEQDMRNASESFTGIINNNTNKILNNILIQLGLKTTIELPSSFRDLFSQLEFTSISHEKTFPLKQRGDGIKVRHIPIVLRWLAEQANHLSAPGRPKTITIWGYEEPENNLELSRCFELAQEFVDGAETIQTFITTHSPAFYSISRNDSRQIRLFSVKKDTTLPITTIRAINAEETLSSLDSSMGLLDLLEPHYKKIKEELEKLKKNQNNFNTSIPTIFCEGPSDKELIEAALKECFSDQADKLAVLCSNDNGGGHEWVKDMIIAWSHIRPKEKAIGVFDSDEGAQRSLQKLDEQLKNAGKEKVAWLKLIRSPEIKECNRRRIKMPYSIEELFPENIWTHAENAGWLEDRPDLLQIYKFNQRNISFDDYINTTVPERHYRRITLKKIAADSKIKKAFCKYIISLENNERRTALDRLKPTLEKCLKKLDLIKDDEDKNTTS